MEIKGTAVVAIRDYVKLNHKEEYDKWIDSMPGESSNLFKGAIDSSKWYPLKEGGIIPTKKAVDLLFEGNYEKGPWIMGRFSAEKALTGIYKIFVKASSPGYIVQRASRIFATYYQPCKMEAKKSTDNSTLLEISDMTESDPVIENRIGGWIEKALEISGAGKVTFDIPKSITRGDDVTQFDIHWE
ncbi:MAG: hypothetical protein PVF73_04560 [Bacteroidales bacterium]|jgi:hypothetical protein